MEKDMKKLWIKSENNKEKLETERCKVLTTCHFHCNCPILAPQVKNGGAIISIVKWFKGEIAITHRAQLTVIKQYYVHDLL